MKYSWSAPEIIQTSSMDCGPACLKSLLQGLDIPINYTRLREACQTSVDGTSIDNIEDIACKLGLNAQQVLVPLNHLSLTEARTTPAIAISKLPNNINHFIVIWRSFGPWVQVMDPSTGRLWMRWESLKKTIYQHEMSIPKDEWFDWSLSDEYQQALIKRLQIMGLGQEEAFNLLTQIRSQSIHKDSDCWRPIACMDAAMTWTELLVRSGALRRGREARLFIEQQYLRTKRSQRPWVESIPSQYWWVMPDEKDEGLLRVRAAVLVRVIDTPAPTQESNIPDVLLDTTTTSIHQSIYRDKDGNLSPWKILYNLLMPEQKNMLLWFVPLILLGGMCITTQALLFQGLLSMESLLGSDPFGIMVPLILAFILLSIAIEIPIAKGALSLGRQIEIQFRIHLFNKIPRIHDPYFRSRLLTDMANRSHKLYVLRVLPSYLINTLQLVSLIIFTLVGIWWLDPLSGAATSLMVLALMCATLFSQQVLSELETRAETQSGVINLLYFDTLKGLKSIISHSAQSTVQTEQEAQLSRWANTQKDHQRQHTRTLLLIDLIAASCIFVIMMLKEFSAHNFVPNLLWLYWILRLPFLVKQLGAQLLSLPPYKVALSRYAELLDATESGTDDQPESTPLQDDKIGVAIDLDSVSVTSSGHTLLNDINLRIAPGQHLAVVGASGAGKSTLCELLLGWHHPSQGEIRIDGKPLDNLMLNQLRKRTAWVDANVQLWDRSLLDNINYDHGNGSVGAAGLGWVLANMRKGLQTFIGEGGRRLSGGEGQRVRIARALGASHSKLVILDEPCRGLDRASRELLLQNLRTTHSEATLICITHDISEALKFPYVIVLTDGSIAEQGIPATLLKDPFSTLSILKNNEELLLNSLQLSGLWKLMRMHSGQVVMDSLSANKSSIKIPDDKRD